MIIINQNRVLDEVYNIAAEANSKLINIWSTTIVFSWRWWLQVVLTILPWIVWLIIRDKRNTVRLLCVGFGVCILANFLDNIGLFFDLWHYDWKVYPFCPIFIPWDHTLLPVCIMILLQFKPEIKALIKALAMATFAGFIAEPFFSWVSIYHLIHWKFWYSFIIYIPFYLLFSFFYNSKFLKSNEKI